MTKQPVVIKGLLAFDCSRDTFKRVNIMEKRVFRIFVRSA